jgi:ammonia channel protein AmtB
MSSGDTAWVLTCAALVFIMTPGVALFYGGMARRKNAEVRRDATITEAEAGPVAAPYPR